MDEYSYKDTLDKCENIDEEMGLLRKSLHDKRDKYKSKYGFKSKPIKEGISNKAYL